MFGTLSILLDVPFVMDQFGLTGEVLYGSPIGRAAQSLTVLRVVRLARVVRIVSKLRVVRLFRALSRQKQAKLYDRTVDPAKVAQYLSDRLMKRLVMLVLVLLLLGTVLDSQEIDVGLGKLLGLKLVSLTVDNLNVTTVELEDASRSNWPEALEQQVDTFVETFDYSLRSLQVAGVPVYQDAQDEEKLRSFEIDYFVLPNAEATFRIRDKVSLQALFSLLTTMGKPKDSFSKLKNNLPYRVFHSYD